MEKQAVQQDMTIESQLQASGEITVQNARSMSIISQQDYEDAGKVLVEIKTRAKQVKEYWKPLKEAASKSHKALCDKEKAMLNPLDEAERIIKGAMIKFQQAVEIARQREIEEARKRQEEEAQRLIDTAIAAEENGDAAGAAIGMAMAEMVEDMPVVPAAVVKPAASGTSMTKRWKARVVDPTQVPAYMNGMELRTINQSALDNIARMSKGAMMIPGVEFYEEATISARSK